MKTIVFFGAGSIGKRMLNFWRQINKVPNFFADNAEERWGDEYCGIRILSLEELRKIKNIHIIVTCNQYEIIMHQLENCDICSQRIFKGNTLYDMLYYLAKNLEDDILSYKISPNVNCENVPKVLFDLTNNFVLGGVEMWTIKTANTLSERGAEVKYIIPNFIKECCVVSPGSIIDLHFKEVEFFDRRVEIGLKEIQKYIPCNIICNFPLAIFDIICAAKLKWPQEINLIAVVHNDEEVYYKRYCDLQELIDICLVISSKIKSNLLGRGFPKNKIKKLEWEISCTNNLNRTYSEKNQILHIGYAGRITIEQKRIDLLVEVSKMLHQQDINFVLEIAGVGDYLHTLEENLKKEELYEKIKLLGYIPNDKINTFWERQDIVISCSDYEGRSIALAEAMASGVVPITTNTSGSVDYVRDGYNGYIVSVGDIGAIAEKVYYLYYHRDLLKVMGERCRQKILRQNRENNLSSMWEKILKIR